MIISNHYSDVLNYQIKTFDNLLPHSSLAFHCMSPQCRFPTPHANVHKVQALEISKVETHNHKHSAATSPRMYTHTTQHTHMYMNCPAFERKLLSDEWTPK